MSRKENALDLAKFIDKGVRVKLSGGREGKPVHMMFVQWSYEIIYCARSKLDLWMCSGRLTERV